MLFACERPTDPTQEIKDSSQNSKVFLDRYTNTSEVLERFAANLSPAKQVDSLIFLTKVIRNYDERAALLYANKAYSIALEKNWISAKAVSAYYVAALKGETVNNGESIEDALVDAHISQRLFEQMDKPYWNARIYSLLGSLYNRQEKYDSAKVYLYHSLEDLEQLPIKDQNISLLKGEIYHDLFNIFSTSDSSLALQYFQKSDSLIPENTALWIDLGLFHLYDKKYDKTDSLFQKAIDHSIKRNNLDHLARAYQMIGMLRSEQYSESGEEKHFLEAIQYLNQAKYHKEEDLYFIYQQMGVAFQLKAIWTDVLQGTIDSTLYYYKLGMQEARKEGALGITKVIGENIAVLCDWLSQDTIINCADIFGETTTIFLNNNYAGIVDSLTQSAKIAYQRTNAVEQRELRAGEKRNRQRQLSIAAGILIASIFIFIVLLQRQQQKRLIAKMEALRAQINPHFISNSLNAIESLVNHDKKEAAAKYIIHFSRLARRILNNSREPITTLAGEIQTLKHFLALEQLRFRDKLNFDIQIAADLNAEQIEVPAMIMQPYLENAIWHGIKPKKGSGFLQIKVNRVGKFLNCIIEDNGIGRAKAAELKAASVLKQKSVGMKITEERLRMGNVKGAKVETIDLYHDDGTAAGTRILLRLPYKLKKPKKR